MKANKGEGCPVGFIPNTDQQRQKMLEYLGLTGIEELFASIPQEARLAKRLNLPEPVTEMELMGLMRHLSEKNGDVLKYVSFLGAGAYNHYVPSVVDHITGRSEFYTCYTPYQAEVSQGTLQTIFEFQSMICELTEMDVANASLYDGATALAEAAFMACNVTRRNRVLVATSVHPEYRMVLRTYCQGRGIDLEEVPCHDGQVNTEELSGLVTEDTAALLVQHPNFFGCLEEVETLGNIIHEKGGLFVVCVNPVSLGLLKPPGAYGADIAVGEGQALGNYLYFGGPYLGFFAAREAFIRHLPGRLVSQTRDAEGNPAYVLTLQTREQHIRRARATSNICTNEALCALAATVYLAVLGPEGLADLARLCLQKAHYAFNRITSLPGFEPVFPTPFFHEFVIRVPFPPADLNRKLLDRGIIGGLPLGWFYPDLADTMLFCVTEVISKEEIDRLVAELGRIG